MKPPEPEVRALAAGWLAKARIDLLVCDSLLAQCADLWEAVAFHCQQAAEKALKALLVWYQVEFPKTHDIQRLLDLLSDVDSDVVGLVADAAELTPFGVEYRYPGEYPPVERDAACMAVTVARRVYEAAAGRVGAE
jgi:HEPN domain-containing protein